MRVGRVAAASDPGRKRRRNEDSYVLEPPLFAVADGMGGAQAGEVASRLAAGALKEGGRALEELIQEANRRVHQRSIEMSFCPPRPIVTAAESSSNVVPGSSAGLLRTVKRPVWYCGCGATPAPSAAPAAPARRMKLSCGSRTSRAALLTIRQMKR